MKKKVGIVTIYDEDNYGNRLQNYAVQKVLESLNCEVETIRNTNIVNGINYFEKAQKETTPERKRKFQEFNDKNIKYTEKIYIHSEIEEEFHKQYDYFVIGSDQIWNYNIPDRFSNFSFADFAPREKRISYSASIGISEVPKSKHNKYKELENLKAISVREEAGAKIVKEITGRDDVVVLLDPTMMLDKAQWEQVMKKPEKLNSNRYILKYFLGKISEDKEKKIQKFVKENNYEIIDVLDEESLGISGPSEFIYLINNADIVLTDSFHSCIFSIIFNKPFYIFTRKSNIGNMYSRIETLLKKFDLEDREFNEEVLFSNLNVDYSHIEEILEKEKEKTINFLKYGLDIK